MRGSVRGSGRSGDQDPPVSAGISSLLGLGPALCGTRRFCPGQPLLCRSMVRVQRIQRVKQSSADRKQRVHHCTPVVTTSPQLVPLRSLASCHSCELGTDRAMGDPGGVERPLLLDKEPPERTGPLASRPGPAALRRSVSRGSRPERARSPRSPEKVVHSFHLQTIPRLTRRDQQEQRAPVDRDTGAHLDVQEDVAGPPSTGPSSPGSPAPCPHRWHPRPLASRRRADRSRGL